MSSLYSSFSKQETRFWKKINSLRCVPSESFVALHAQRQILQEADVKHWDPRARNSWTCLYIASGLGDLEMVRELLQHKEVINVVNGRSRVHGTTALMACLYDHLPIVCEFLKHKEVDVNIRTQHGDNALSIASAKKRWDIVREVLNHEEVDVNVQCERFRTPLFIACGEGHVEIICRLLQHEKVNVNLRDEHGSTPLMIACAKGSLRIVRTLLLHDVDVNAQDKEGETPLIKACLGGSLDIACELLKCKEVDVNAQDVYGRTPLIVACSIFRWPNTHIACSIFSWPNTLNRDLPLVRYLLKDSRLKVNLRDKKGHTALCSAVRRDRWDIVLQLSNHTDADLNIQGALGNTALIWACLRGRLDVVCELLEDSRVDVSVRNKAGSTALDIARKCDLFEIASYLEEHTKARLCRE